MGMDEVGEENDEVGVEMDRGVEEEGEISMDLATCANEGGPGAVWTAEGICCCWVCAEACWIRLARTAGAILTLAL